jgi:rubrerythrin
MTDVEMLRMALGEEEKAIKLYEGMMRDHPNLKDLLFELVSSEQRHKQVIEKKISEMTR